MTIRVLDLFPEDFVLEISSASGQAWSYFGSKLRHCIVYLQERNEGVGGMDPMRLLISEGKLVRIVAHYEGRKLVTTKHTSYGPVAAISTTTKNRLKIDDETRHMSAWIDESEDQTRKILDAEFAGSRKLTPQELETWRMVHRILRKRIGTKIIFPKWFAKVSQNVYAGDVRVRRYFPAFIDACRTVSLIRSFQRGRKYKHGALEVDFADYAITALIFDHVFVESLPALGKATGEVTRQIVESISLATGKHVGAEELAHQLRISKVAAYRKLNYALRAGVIRIANKLERTNRKKYWALPPPHFVPDPKRLFRKLGLKETVKFVHPLTGERIVYEPKH